MPSYVASSVGLANANVPNACRCQRIDSAGAGVLLMYMLGLDGWFLTCTDDSMTTQYALRKVCM
jgi:hypothetical protein